MGGTADDNGKGILLGGTAGDHKGPPGPASSALAPTD